MLQRQIAFQHLFTLKDTAPPCTFLPILPDLICDTFVTIGFPCRPPPPEQDGTDVDSDFDPGEFAFNGHVVGGWFDENFPRLILDGLGVTFYFGGTSLLIIVGVAMDLVSKIESHLLMRHYEGFVPSAGRIRGRRG